MLVLLNALQAGNRSGTGRYATELARWLPQLTGDFQFAVLWPADVPHPHRETGLHEAFLPQDVRSAWRRLYLDQIGIRDIRTRLMANIVHYPASVGSLFAIHNAVVTIHDLSFFREPQWFRPAHAAYYRFAVRRSVYVARRIIADSQATARDLHDLLRVPQDRIDVIPLGVGEDYCPAPAEAIAAVRGKYRLPPQFFLFLGTLEPRKNVVRLIEAWSAIAGECPYDLVLAGRDGWKSRPIHKAVAASPFASRIHLPGFIAHEDLPALLSAARAFVWPSLWEGFGLPPLEAMACGTPVLTSNVSSLPEAVGGAALTVDPYSMEAIAEGMKHLADDEVLRNMLRAKGLERAATFTWRRTAEATIETYRATLALG